MLAVRNLSKSFQSGNNRQAIALDSLTTSAQGGDCVCLLGPNGSGKTTFLKILSGLIIADSGQASVGGYDLAAQSRRVQGIIGFSPAADRSFYGRLDGYENLRFFAGIRGISTKTLTERLEALGQPLGLSEILPVAYQKLSSGMKQRLSLARAVLHDPAVLLLDEPTRSVDPQGAQKIKEYLRAGFLNAGRLVIWTTQQPDEAWELSTKLMILRSGKVLAQGSPEEILKGSGASSPAQAYRFWTSQEPSAAHSQR